MYRFIGKSVLNDNLGSSTDPCYIQNRVIMNRVIKRLRCIIVFSYYRPLQIWTLKICNHDISKTIIARSFKLGQLIEDDE